MEFMKFDPAKETHLFFYNNEIIATICGKDGYFLLETYPPLIHDRVVLHTRDKDDVMLEATQYLYDVARQTVDIFISLRDYNIEYFNGLVYFIEELVNKNRPKSAFSELIKGD